MLNDEIVDEVRAIQEAHAAKFGYDLRAIYEDLKRTEAEHLAVGHPFVSPPNLEEIKRARFPGKSVLTRRRLPVV